MQVQIERLAEYATEHPQHHAALHGLIHTYRTCCLEHSFIALPGRNRKD